MCTFYYLNSLLKVVLLLVTVCFIPTHGIGYLQQTPIIISFYNNKNVLLLHLKYNNNTNNNNMLYLYTDLLVQDNHMKVNSDKCQCIVFGNVVNPDTFLINGNVVRPEERVKLLRVHIDNKLNFGHHVSHICQTAGKQVKVLGQLSRVLNESNKLLL